MLIKREEPDQHYIHTSEGHKRKKGVVTFKSILKSTDKSANKYNYEIESHNHVLLMASEVLKGLDQLKTSMDTIVG